MTCRYDKHEAMDVDVWGECGYECGEGRLGYTVLIPFDTYEMIFDAYAVTSSVWGSSTGGEEHSMFKFKTSKFDFEFHSSMTLTPGRALLEAWSM